MNTVNVNVPMILVLEIPQNLLARLNIAIVVVASNIALVPRIP